MQSEPMVSIVIPVYNGENYLQTAIQSALNQTYSNIEVIVVNDGSDDAGKTRDIAMGFGDKIRYFEKTNGGVASAVNLAIREMKGEYFSWLSHDDMYYPDKIETQIQALRDCGDMLRPVFGGYDICVMPENRIIPYTSMSEYFSENIEKNVFCILSGLVNTVTVMVHKSCFEKYGMFNESLISTQDYDMWFRIFLHEDPLYVPKALIKWRNHPEQGIYNISTHNQNCDRLYLGFFNRMMEEPKRIEDIYGSMYRFLFEMADFYYRSHFKEAYQQVFKQLIKCQEPESDQNVMLHKILNNNPTAKIVCFGAGVNGKYLERSLMVRGIDIDYFADNDKNKWGKEINAHICISPSEIEKNNDIVIVAILQDEAVLDQLNNLGIKHVVRAKDLEREIHYTLPKRDRIQEFFDTLDC